MNLNGWKLRGVILEFVRRMELEANLRWALGCLTKGFDMGRGEAIKVLRNDPTIKSEKCKVEYL